MKSMELSADHRRIIDQELSLLQQLRQAVGAARGVARRAELPDLRVPCFAHLRIQPHGEQRPRDLLLGFCTLIDARSRVSLIHWRTAPLAAVLFNYCEGDAYEEEQEGRLIRGRVERKRLLSFEQGELVRVECGEVTLSRQGQERWRAVEATPAPRLAGGPPITDAPLDPEQERLPLVQAGLLDRQQQALMERSGRQPLLILGGAGCGKTTVALHRLAHLQRQDPRRYAQRKMVVVVPEPGLARLCSLLLARLDLEQVEVRSFDQWVAAQARKLFRDLPTRLCGSTPGLVVKVKRHPALITVLPRLVRLRFGQLARWLDRQLAGAGKVQRLLLQTDPEQPSLQRLESVQQRLLGERPARQHKQIRQALSSARKQLFAARDDLLHLYGDDELMALAAQRSGGELTPRALSTLLAHTRDQFSRTARQAYAHVDHERLQTADGRSLSDGTPDEAAGTADVEDLAVCLELLRLKTGGRRTNHARLSRYAHMVVDEAQELAPIELTALGRALGRGASVTISGDHAQQMDPTTCFTSWGDALDQLGVERSSPVHLRTSYRCTAPVTALAHHVLGPLAPHEAPRTVRDGAPVELTRCPTEAHAGYLLVRALADLTERDPGATVAVITRTPAGARKVHALLSRSLPVRLVQAGEFSFCAGIDVTDVAQVKGLEFDVVVLPDATPNHYPDEPAARRALHVACTRAIHQLWVLFVGRPAPMLP